MELGVHLPTLGPHATAESIVSVARYADERGLHSVWLYDHLITPVHMESRYPYHPDGVYGVPPEDPYFEAVTVLSHLSGVTSRVRLGTLVLIPVLRHPVVLAKQLATLDQLSAGRVTLGVGTGWLREELEAFDVGLPDRGARLEEHVTLMRQTWERPVSSFSGTYYRMPEAGTVPGPVSGRIPVLFGGHSDAALDRAARLGDGWAVTARPSDDVIGAYAERLRKLRELCDKAGRRFEDLRIVAQAAPTAGVDHLRRLAELGVHEVSLRSPGRPDLTMKLLDRLPTQVT